LFLTWQDMVKGFMFGSSISIWDAHKNETVRIGIRTCWDSSIISICWPCGVENCIMVLIEIVHEDYGQWKLFCPIRIAKYYELAIGMEIFWPCKDFNDWWSGWNGVRVGSCDNGHGE
jgi:hypothetical protein